MPDTKTRPGPANVRDFINGLEDESRRKDCRTLGKIMRDVTGCRATMWGSNIVGFGRYRYRYASGREGEFFLCGFSPRKKDLTVYVVPGFSGFEPLLARLGRHRTGKSCLYVKNLEDIDREALEALIEKSVTIMRARYETI